MSSFGRILLLGAFVLAGTSAACGAPEPIAKEKRGTSQSTLSKPKASIRTAASQDTTDKYGITEWRMFRGKKDLFMTGYDADGEAVKGVSLAIGKSADDGEAEITTRVHDGSKFTAARNLTTQNLTATDLPAGTADFLKQVLGDLGGLDQLFNGGGLDAAGVQLPAGAEGCGADITAILNQALSCTSDAGQAKAAQAACVAAAKKAAESATACQNVGTVDATNADNAGDAAGGIDLSQLGLPDLGALGGGAGGAGGAGIDLSKILPADLQNPFANAGAGDAAGGLDLKNPFGGGLSDLFGNAQNGDVGFEEFGGLFGF